MSKSKISSTLVGVAAELSRRVSAPPTPYTIEPTPLQYAAEPKTRYGESE